MSSTSRIVRGVLAMGLTLGMTGAAWAQNWMSAQSGSWSEGTTWTNGVPPAAGKRVIVTGSGATPHVVVVDSQDAVGGYLNSVGYFGNSGTLRIVDGGKLTLDTTSYIAAGAGMLGWLSVEGGELVSSGGIYATSGGGAGTALFEISGGLVRIHGLAAGHTANTFGTIKITGGVVSNITQAVELGYNAGATGILEMTDGVLHSTGQLRVLGGSGFLTQSGGSVTISSAAFLGTTAGSRGEYRISGGTLAVTDTLNLGGIGATVGGYGLLGVEGTNATVTIGSHLYVHTNSVFEATLTAGGLNPPHVGGNVYLYNGAKLRVGSQYAGMFPEEVTLLTFDGSLLDVSRFTDISYVGTLETRFEKTVLYESDRIRLRIVPLGTTVLVR